MNQSDEYILFVTGRLAEPALRKTVAKLVQDSAIRYEISVLGISVAALMHVDWVARKLEIPAGITQVVLPGWCQGDLSVLEKKYKVSFVRGPKDLRQLPQFWGNRSEEPVVLDQYDIDIIAEINHAPLLSEKELIEQATKYRFEGADLIDYGSVPGSSSAVVRDHVKLLIKEGFRVSIDSFDQKEVEAAVDQGAELVLSCNSTNCHWAAELDVEFVVIPDDFSNLLTMQPTIDCLLEKGRSVRLDPILEPIGFGFFESLKRYAQVRKQWPELPTMMGIGNVSELSEVDSAGVNFLLIAICQELQISSVLTTQVINWARSSVREIDLARRMLKYSFDQQQLPKHLDSGLVMLRDPYLYRNSEEALEQMAGQIKDPNFRIYSQENGLHLINRDGHWIGEDPFEMFSQIEKQSPVDPAHAFYLGYELAQAELARQLGKQYTQDEPLDWGIANSKESSQKDRHYLRKNKKKKS